MAFFNNFKANAAQPESGPAPAQAPAAQSHGGYTVYDSPAPAAQSSAGARTQAHQSHSGAQSHGGHTVFDSAPAAQAGGPSMYSVSAVNAPAAGQRPAAQAPAAQASSGNAYNKHLNDLQSHLSSKKTAYDRARQAIDASRINRTTEIDESGMDVIGEQDIPEYCAGLASTLAPDMPGFARTLEAEIKNQKGRFQVGGLQPMMKADAHGGAGDGTFHLVQVAAVWNKGNIAIQYFQKGCIWKTPPGARAPDMATMVDFYQYKAVESLVRELGKPK